MTGTDTGTSHGIPCYTHDIPCYTHDITCYTHDVPCIQSWCPMYTDMMSHVYRHDIPCIQIWHAMYIDMVPLEHLQPGETSDGIQTKHFKKKTTPQDCWDFQGSCTRGSTYNVSSAFRTDTNTERRGQNQEEVLSLGWGTGDGRGAQGTNWKPLFLWLLSPTGSPK